MSWFYEPIMRLGKYPTSLKKEVIALKKLSKGLATGLLSTGLLIAGAGVAEAAQHYVGGGIWTEGMDSKNTYSNYYHPSRHHGSTACNAFGCDRKSAPAGKTSFAAVPRTSFGNKTYWR